ncbi:DUF6415 family natural product biosynthesis protein [Streptomyces sp. NPDC059479]|uniref:DUF6415 family natural product biosynthesis protein n=1 Tax=Streptomyces sp. NPDC059479 TaxID=3346848 RepID=UPI003694B1C1
MTLNRRTPGAHWHWRALKFATDTASLRRLVAALSRRPADRPADRLAGRSVDCPVDLATVSYTVEKALARQVGLPKRAWVDTTTHELRGHLALLLGEDLGDTDTPQARALYRTAYALLDRDARPDPYVSPAHAYDHMRALAWSTRTFAALYQRRQEERRQ